MFRFVLICTLLVIASAQFQRSSNYYGGSRSAPSSSQFSGSQSARAQSFSPRQNYDIIPILRYNQEGPENGVYSFDFETGNGIIRSEQGQQGPSGGANKQGAWSFTFPDGTPAQFSFVADEGGYQVQSNLIPTPHPLPAHAVEQIAKAERERAAGIIHDGSYDHSRYGGSSSSSSQNVRRGGGGSFRRPQPNRYN